MKKLISIFSITLLFSSLIHLDSYAMDNTTTEEEHVEDIGDLPNAGIKPDSAFYGVDKFFENLSLRLTFSDEKKAEKLAKIGEERLAELNELDDEKAEEWADILFNEYGLSLEKANLYTASLIAEGKISEEKVTRLENRLDKALQRQDKLSNEAKNKITDEVKNEVNDSIRNAKMSIFSRFTDAEKANQLHEEGFGYGQILKLQAISELTNVSIDELVVNENIISTSEDGEKQIDLDAVYSEYNISQEELKDKLAEYRSIAKDQMKQRLSEVKQQATQRKEEIKDRLKERSNNRDKANK